MYLVYADGSGVESVAAAITGAHAGVERSWHRGTWYSHARYVRGAIHASDGA